MKEDDLLTPEKLMDMYQNDRGYASYYAPPTNATPEEKALYELGAAKDLIKSHKELEINPPYINPQISEADPPDCISEDNVAIEMTELVNQEAVGMNSRIKQGRAGDKDFPCYGKWNKSIFEDEIKKRINIKDQKKFIGGPYKKYILVIYTDEFMLEYSDSVKWIKEITPIKTNLLDRVYLLFSYKPKHVPARPFIEIPIIKE